MQKAATAMLFIGQLIWLVAATMHTEDVYRIGLTVWCAAFVLRMSLKP